MKEAALIQYIDDLLESIRETIEYGSRNAHLKAKLQKMEDRLEDAKMDLQSDGGSFIERYLDDVRSLLADIQIELVLEKIRNSDSPLDVRRSGRRSPRDGRELADEKGAVGPSDEGSDSKDPSTDKESL